jgi:flagellin-specific chaperone FliS|tara:strand:- start:483 stop:860 length:378 start_codon:yes stop_codon:yes gene_type:complete
METRKTVFNKLFKSESEKKTELSKHKIELGLIDDFKKVSKKAINSGANAGGDIEDWISKLPKLISSLKKSLNDQEKVIEIGNKMQKIYKELGGDLPPNIKKDLEGAEQWKKEIKSIIKKAQSFKF